MWFGGKTKKHSTARSGLRVSRICYPEGGSKGETDIRWSFEGSRG